MSLLQTSQTYIHETLSLREVIVAWPVARKASPSTAAISHRPPTIAGHTLNPIRDTLLQVGEKKRTEEASDIKDSSSDSTAYTGGKNKLAGCHLATS